MQNLAIIIILFKKVVSLHLLKFQDGRRQAQHFHFKSRAFYCISVYKFFENSIYESHICNILKGIGTTCSVKNLF